ncbi:hypothetical protein ACFSPU_11755 [Haoranjiania flava]|uniref:YtxH domain-containing protein n=1 Tax=Haoranjiania flava TaxID=1856322 RepID=A0AAE3IPM1_9BACT|nr:hypothetical protein [Haoranjiania flava]MCU7693512.1 hypothetical protein [Haoranjiania flava]
MSNKKFVSGLALGILAGSMISLFLRSRKGQELVEEVESYINKAFEEVKFGIDNIDITLERLFHRRRNLLGELDPEKDFTDYDEIFS